MSPLTALVIVLLVAVTALYVAAEFAAVSARRSRVRQLAEEGSGLARVILPVVEDPRELDRYVAACQVGITLSSLALGAFGQASLSAALTPVFEDFGAFQGAGATAAATVVLVGLTSFTVVLGELIPKSLALQFPVSMLLWTSVPMRWSLWLFAPFIWALNGSGVAVLRLLGMPQHGHRHIHSPNEISLLIAESRDGGLLEPDEQARLSRALQLSVQPIRRLMVPRVHLATIDIADPVDEVLARVTNEPYTRLPVYRDSPDNIIGMLHTKDLVLSYLRNGGVQSIEPLLRRVVTVPDSVRADGLLAILREERSQQALVIDEFGGVAGLVTLDDVLAEVFGGMADEFKGAEPEPERTPDGRVRLPGQMHLDDAEPWLGVRWEGEAETVGGRITEELGHLPQPGEQATIDGVDVEVERVAHNAVVSMLARPAPSDSEVTNDA
jgi:CBS domain containing-hemolysin-like protein